MSLITREDQPIAAVLHDPASLDAVMLQQEIGPAARLAIENERLRAEARAQTRELKTSRTRIVEAGDAERRRLERDLHDGAQQRLVGAVALVLAMARRRSAAPGTRARGRRRAAPRDRRPARARPRHPSRRAQRRRARRGAGDARRSRAGAGRTWRRSRRARAGHGRDRGLRARRRGPSTRRATRRRRRAQRGRAPRRRRARRWRSRDDVLPPSTRCWPSWVGVADRISALDGRLTAHASDDGGAVLRAELPCA